MQTLPPTNPSLPTLRQPSVSASKLAILVLVIAIIGLILVMRFANAEQNRELVHWQNKLNLIADSRAADIGAWLDRQFRDLRDVANNPSVQLYVTQLENPQTAASPIPSAMPEEPAQAVFLRNMLLVTADRLGFLSKTADALSSVHANIAKPTGTGLAIVDNNGKVLVSTEGLSTFEPGLARKIADAPRGTTTFLDMFVSETGDVRIGFVLPVYPIQGDPTAAQQIGKLVGIKKVEGDLFSLLQQPGAAEQTLEALLIRRDGDSVVYLSPLQSDAPLATHFAMNTPDLDAAYALTSPGIFALRRDRLSHAVLMTSRAIAHSPWTLLLHIDRDQALAESNGWRSKMEMVMLFALVAMIASIIAVWWYGTSRRAMLLSEQTGRLAAHSIAQEKLLRLVTDNQPEPIFIADGNHVVRFSNEKAAQRFQLPVQDVAGKDLAALFGTATAAPYLAANDAALKTQKTLSRTERVGQGSAARILRSEHIPLVHIPIEGLPNPSPGVLVVDQDVTDIVTERERRLRILRQLIQTLVRMMDERDPYAANHSAGVALVARETALALELTPLQVDAAEIAGNLMNIGKILVPSAVLTKRAALAQDEKQAIRDSLQGTLTLLKDIDFDGPVVETLRQSQEHVDGTGPLGLKGENILITARIIAVANSFIGIISPRSYRAAISMDQATSLLMQNIDTQFDRRVVVSLINFIENKKGKEMLARLVGKKAG